MKKLSTKEVLAFADFHEGYLSRYIVLADAKAGVSFSINAALIGYLVSRDWFPALLRGQVLNQVWSYGLLVGLLLGAGLSFWVVVPRLRRSAEGLIFWQSVREHQTEEDFADALKSSAPEALAEARLSHCYALAGVAKGKYFWLVMAAWVTAASVFGTGALVLSAGLVPKSEKPIQQTIIANITTPSTQAPPVPTASPKTTTVTAVAR